MIVHCVLNNRIAIKNNNKFFITFNKRILNNFNVIVFRLIIIKSKTFINSILDIQICDVLESAVRILPGLKAETEAVSLQLRTADLS